MRYRVLGSLQVWDGTSWCGIRAAQQRVVLAVLLIDSEQVVSTDRLIDEIWGARPPAAALSTVHGYVLRLRRLLGDVAREHLLTREHGYQLVVGADDLDARIFEQLVDRGRVRLAQGATDAGAADLADALDLWRGQPFADVPECPTVSAESNRLDQARISALEEHLAVQLDLGRHGEVVEQLVGLTRAFPLRERLWAHLMLALHRCGRRAEALDAYQRIRTTLVDELGVEPGQAIRDLHRAVLADDDRLTLPPPPITGRPTAVVHTPAQLPADVTGFTGREIHLRRLDDAWQGERPGRVLITGPAGVGKTALAARWAHRMRDRFPDGQLFVDMRGHAADTPLEPIEVLGRFLRALGMPSRDIPVDVQEAAAHYRSLLAQRNVLIVLDNVRHPAQVRPLIPNGPGCMVMVTSRDRLDGLVARDGATCIDLGPLAPDEAQQLLRVLVGPRAHAEAAAAEELSAHCGGLPLALRIAAATLTSRPGVGLATYNEMLHTAGRLNTLQVEDDPEATVRAAFDLSYDTLSEDGQRLFRLLGLAPGEWIAVAPVARLGAVSTEVATRLLSELTRAHLVDEPEPGRYRLHDLVREYAAEQAACADTPADTRAALARLFDDYLGRVAAAALSLYPHFLRLPDGPVGEAFADADAAAAWLEGELANLVAIAGSAARFGPPQVAWRLADLLRGYLYTRMRVPEWRALARAGLEAAQAEGEPRGSRPPSCARRRCVSPRASTAKRSSTTRSRCAPPGWRAGTKASQRPWATWAIFSGHWATCARRPITTGRPWPGMNTPARRRTRRPRWTIWVWSTSDRVSSVARSSTTALALEHHRQVGSSSGEARTLTHLGDVYRAQGRLSESRAALEEALNLVRSIGDRNVEGDTLQGLAHTYGALDRAAEGLDLASAAVDLARETGDQRMEVGSLTTWASLSHRLALDAQAIEGYESALRIAESIGNRYLQTEAALGLAESLLRVGEPGQARLRAEQARQLAVDGGYRALAARADALGARPTTPRQRRRPPSGEIRPTVGGGMPPPPAAGGD